MPNASIVTASTLALLEGIRVKRLGDHRPRALGDTGPGAIDELGWTTTMRFSHRFEVGGDRVRTQRLLEVPVVSLSEVARKICGFAFRRAASGNGPGLGSSRRRSSLARFTRSPRSEWSETVMKKPVSTKTETGGTSASFCWMQVIRPVGSCRRAAAPLRPRRRESRRSIAPCSDVQEGGGRLDVHGRVGRPLDPGDIELVGRLRRHDEVWLQADRLVDIDRAGPVDDLAGFCLWIRTPGYTPTPVVAGVEGRDQLGRTGSSATILCACFSRTAGWSPAP